MSDLFEYEVPDETASSIDVVPPPGYKEVSRIVENVNGRFLLRKVFFEKMEASDVAEA